MQKIKNIAIIAHVDHGKTTLVDRILYQSNLFRANQQVQDLLLGSNDLERERGITIFYSGDFERYHDVTFSLLDIQGKLLLHEPLTDKPNTIALHQIPSGIYLVKIDSINGL